MNQPARRAPAKDRIVLVDHHENPPDDRVTTHLRKLGYALDLRRPAEGDALDAADQEWIDKGGGDEDFPGDLAGTVIFGGSHNVGEMPRYPFLRDEIAWIQACHRRRIPLLGICLGAQLIAHAFGAEISPMADGNCEFGYYPVTPTPEGRAWMPQPLHVTQAHFQQFDLPRDATLLARGENCANQAFRCGQHTYAVQFHPEVTAKIFRRWQNADWAFFDAPGAQSRDQQDALLAEHDARQHEWFIGFLDGLFGGGR